ncbi:MAG: efflux RND transporter periplasmic adaptor subunit [Armatimonadetes bacterium]|nr:efflux RND transporter periplasmic adaptor subunit [Armatimonadota bacterium]
MSTQTVASRTIRWIPIGIVAIVALAGSLMYFAFRSSPSSTVAKAADTALTVPEGQAGKAGELVISQEAMRLAEIQVQPATARLVSERLSVSGVVQVGGDQLVKVTPRVAGKVIKLFAGAGDTVRAGQTLALLESAELGQSQAGYRQAAARVTAASKNLERQRQLAKLGQFGKPQVEEARTKAIEAERDVQLAERNLGEDRTKLAEAQSEQQGLVSKVTQARAEMDVTKARFDRAETLFKEELISKQELERVSADYKKAAADVSVAMAAVAQGVARIEGAKARVDASLRELMLAKRRALIVSQAHQREESVYNGQFSTNRELVEAESALRLVQVEMRGAVDAVRLLGGKPGGHNTIALITPISGKVQERLATLGETIDPEHAAFTVVNLDLVWAQLAVAPGDLAAVRVGQLVELGSEAAPGNSFRGRVLSVGTAADETTRAVSVRTTLGNRGNVLRPGSFVKGTIVTDLRKHRVTVPEGALQEHTGRATVYIATRVRPGAFEIRHVTLGIRDHGWREITAGLAPGEPIAVNGTFYLKSEALKSSLSDGCCAPGG